MGHGDPAGRVVSLAREPDLGVIDIQAWRFDDSVDLGVTTVRVTPHAPCPVLAVLLVSADG